MDFTLSDEQRALQTAAREYAQKRLPAIAQDIETSGEPPSRALIAEFASHGFLGINIPEALGGLGQGNLEALIVLEEFAKISSAVASPVFESCVGPVRAIEKFANDMEAVIGAKIRGIGLRDTHHMGVAHVASPKNPYFFHLRDGESLQIFVRHLP